MAHASNAFDQTSLSSLSPPDNILNFVNEKLLLTPTQQQRTSKLQNYFLGYREFLGTPPSPAPSDEDKLFSFTEESSTSLDAVLPSPLSPSVLLQTPLKAASQGRLNCTILQCGQLLIIPVDPSRSSKPTPYSYNGSQCIKGNQGSQRRKRIASTRTHKDGRLVKACTQTPHHMETRSRARARRRKKELEGVNGI